MARCKITVAKILFHSDIAAEHCRDWIGPCSVFSEGQEFLLDDPWSMPEKFCAAAWGDIFKNVQTICLGGDFPSTLKPGINFACCVDGVRPVVFKIERLPG